MKRIYVIVVLLLTMVAVQAQTKDDEWKAEIDRNFTLSHTPETFVETMSSQLKPLVEQGSIKAEQLDPMVKEMSDVLLPALKEVTTSFYKEHFTLDELKQINAYLASPIGQKTSKLTPELTQKAQAVGQTPEAQQKLQSVLLKYINITPDE